MERAGEVEIFYGDESGFCTEGYVPYGWQFKGERVRVPCGRVPGGRLNCFAMISRQNRCYWWATTEALKGQAILEYLDGFSLGITKKTVLVLDCAALHRCKAIKERLSTWRKRGLWLFYLPPYSPHLNLCETLWRVAKGKWLAPEDYQSKDKLHYSVTSVLNAVGKQATINFNQNDAK